MPQSGTCSHDRTRRDLGPFRLTPDTCCIGVVTDHTTTADQPVPEILVTVYRGGHLVEQRYCQDPETVANIVESLESSPPPDGELLVVEQDSPQMIVALLRAIADAIEQQRPLRTSHPFPHLRLQLATEATEPTRETRGELLLLWQEQAHPGG
jgi:hypothetical protein